MKPRYILTANGNPITDLVSPILNSLTVTDETGDQADRLSIAIDDSSGNLALPPSGALLTLQLGIGTQLVDFGQFTVDSVSGEGGDSVPVLRIEAHAVPMSGSAKMQGRKSRSWAGVTLGDIVEKIAGENGLQSVIAENFAALDLGHLDQTDESDTAFLSRLARDVSAAVKVTAGRLAFIGRGTSRTASGAALPAVTLYKGDLTRWSWIIAARGAYKSVVAKYRDLDTAATTEVLVGEGDPAFRLPHTYSTENGARRAARAKLDDFSRSSGGQIQLSMQARLDIIAETPVVVMGVRQGIDGQYVVRRVSHALTGGGGLFTSVDCEKHLEF